MAMSRVDQLDQEDVRPLRRAEFDGLVRLGAFEDERVELIEGRIVRMPPIGPPHNHTVIRLNKALVSALGDRADVVPQGAFAASDLSEPQPDFAVVPPGDHDLDHPSKAFFLIEVASSSLDRDRRLKGSLYARAGVPEYWVINLVDGLAEVYTKPTDEGYQHTRIVRRGQALTPAAFADVAIPIDDILPRPS